MKIAIDMLALQGNPAWMDGSLHGGGGTAASRLKPHMRDPALVGDHFI